MIIFMSMQNRIINTHPEKAFWGLYLNNVKLDSDIFKVTKIETQVLPEISPKIKELPNAIGNLYSGTSLGSRLVNIELRALGTSLYNHVQMSNKLNQWLKPALYEPVELFIGYDQRKINVVLNTTPEIEKDNFDLIISLEFLAPNPLWRGIEEEADLRFDGNFYTFNNPSNFDCRPTISFKLTKDATNLSVVSGDEALIMGSDSEFGNNLLSTDPFIVNSTCESLNGFINTSNIYGASVVADSDSCLEIDTNNTKIQLAKVDKPFGEQQKWMAISKTIQGRKGTFTDWYSNMVFNFKANNKDKKTLSKIQFEILDTTGTKLAILQASNDSSNYNGIKINIWLCDSLGSPTDRVVKDYKLDKKYLDFYGSFRINKKGNVFEFSLLWYRSKNRKQLLFKKFTDSKKKYNRTPQSISFAFIGFGGKPYTSKISCNHLEIQDKTKINPDTKIPIIAKAGDIIEVDNEEGKIYKNDSLWLENLAINSTFLNFENSDCVFGISPNVATDVKVVFVPVWI